MKKEKEKNNKSFPWQKVLIVAFAVVFALMFIINYLMTAGTLQYFRGVRANDTVTIDLTLRDARGLPVLTTDQDTYRNGIMSGNMPFYTAPLTVRAGYYDNPPVTGIAAQNYYLNQGGQEMKFGLLGDELNGLDQGVLAMKTGEKKTVSLGAADPEIILMKNYEFTAMGGNFTVIGVGDLIPLGISETPMVSGMEGMNETPTNAVWRVGTVINKTADSIEVQHLYPTADIMIRSIK